VRARAEAKDRQGLKEATELDAGNPSGCPVALLCWMHGCREAPVRQKEGWRVHPCTMLTIRCEASLSVTAQSVWQDVLGRCPMPPDMGAGSTLASPWPRLCQCFCSTDLKSTLRSNEDSVPSASPWLSCSSPSSSSSCSVPSSD